MEYKLTIGLKHPGEKTYDIIGYNLFQFGSQFEERYQDYKLGMSQDIIWLRLDLGDRNANVPLDNVAYIEQYVEHPLSRCPYPDKLEDAEKTPGHLR